MIAGVVVWISDCRMLSSMKLFTAELGRSFRISEPLGGGHNVDTCGKYVYAGDGIIMDVCGKYMLGMANFNYALQLLHTTSGTT